MPRDRTTKKSLKSSFSDGLMVLCPAPCRKQYKLTASQRAQPKLAFKQQNCQNKVYSFFFFSNPGDIASIRPLLSASAPNVKKTLTWLQIRSVLSGKAEEFFFLLCSPEHHKQREDKKKKTVRRHQEEQEEEEEEEGKHRIHPRVPPWPCMCTWVACFSLLNLARFAHHCTRAAVCSRSASQWFLCVCVFFYLLQSQQGPAGGWRKVTELEQVTGWAPGPRPAAATRSGPSPSSRPSNSPADLRSAAGQNSKARSDRKPSRQLRMTTRHDTSQPSLSLPPNDKEFPSSEQLTLGGWDTGGRKII